MSKSVFFVVEGNQADALVSLAGRILAYTALERRAHVLFRLAGAVWLNPSDTWPQPSPALQQWLQRQEFKSLADYWQMTLATAQPQLYYCTSGSQPAANGASASSLTRFLLDAEAAGAEAVWL